MATITTSSGFRPSTKDTPLDVRTRVRNYSEIQHIQNAYLGMEITVLEDETNNGKKTKYEVVNLLPSETGIPNALIDVNTLKRKIDIYEDNGNLVVGDSNNEDNSKKLQTKYDDSLLTYNKELPSAINELKIAIDNVDSGSGLTTEQIEQLNTAYNHSQSSHVQQSDIPTKVSDLENDSGYISTIPEEYVTETKLTAKGYLTEHQDLSEYAKTVNIPTKTSNLTNDSEFITSTEMTNAISIYQTIQDDTLSTTDKTVAGAINEVKNTVNLNSENISELSSQLEHKASKNEVFSMDNMGQDIKEAMTGGSVAVVGVHGVLKENIVDKQIVPRKASFFTEALNYELILTIGKIIQPAGAEQENADYYVTDYNLIPSSVTNLSINFNSAFRFYDINKTYISGVSGNNNSVTKPANAVYFRLSGAISNMPNYDDMIVVNGNKVLNKEDIQQIIINDYIKNLDYNSFKDGGIIPEKTSFIRKSKNLFDKSTIQINKGVFPGNAGQLIDDTDCDSFGYFEVEAGKKYICNLPLKYLAFYNKDKVCLGENSIGGTGGFNDAGGTGGLKNVMANTPIFIPTLLNGQACKYVRFSIRHIEAYNSCQFQKGETITSEEEFGKYYLNNNIIIENSTNSSTEITDIFSRFNTLKVTHIGDSHTQQGYYEKWINNKLHWRAIQRLGQGGSTIAKKADGVDFISRYKNTASDSDVITIYGGTNDFAQNIPLENSSNKLDNTYFKGALREMIEYFSINYPSKYLFVFTPCNNKDTANGLGLYIKDYVNAIIEVCKEYSVPLIDLYNNIQINSKNRSVKTEDGTHLTDETNKQVAQIAITKICECIC